MWYVVDINTYLDYHHKKRVQDRGIQHGKVAENGLRVIFFPRKSNVLFSDRTKSRPVFRASKPDGKIRRLIFGFSLGNH
jgi:hypothetical protein